MQGVWSEKDTGEVFPGVEDKGLHALTGKFLGKRQRLTPLREFFLLCPALTCRIFFEMKKNSFPNSSSLTVRERHGRGFS
jgi:hypothetical protein